MTRPITSAMKAHLAGGTTTLATCWKAVLTDGTVVRATSYADTIEYPAGSGEFYLATAGYTQTDVVSSSDLTVDNLDLQSFLSSPEITRDDLKSGRWDYAKVAIFAVNFRDLSATMGSIPIRSGTLGEVNAGRASFTAELRGLIQAYSRRIVRLTTPNCTATLGDSRCKVNLAPFTIQSWVHGTLLGSNRVLLVPQITQPDDWFTNGLITFTSGLNAGLSMEVRKYTIGRLELQEAMPFAVGDDTTPSNPPPAPVAGFGSGDRFTLVAGCMQELIRDCKTKFNNVVNFRGFPYLPGSAIYGGPGTSTSGQPPATQIATYVPPPPAPAPSPTPPPPPPPAPAPGTYPAVPFGSRVDGAYPNGITPTQTAATMDAAVKAMYDAWKTARLKVAPTFTASAGIYAGQTITGAYYVDTNTLFYEPAPGLPAVQAGTVSEGMGYGMLFAVLMAGYDTNAQTIFNGLLKLARARPAAAMLPSYYGGSTLPQTYLMEWRLGLDMSPQGGGFAAQDGDMDIALALLMAHRQWGSAGAINYLAEAQNTIGALKASGFDPTTGIMYVQPIVTSEGIKHDVSRTSDYMAGHFRSFKAATADAFWDTGRGNSLTIVTNVINTYSPTAKLPPGWIWQPLTAPQPSPGDMIEGPLEGIYDANAVRDPLRWGVDFLWSGDAGWGTLASQCVATIKGTAGGDPGHTTWAYNLDGTSHDGSSYFEPPTVACTMVGGMTNAAHQAWVDACWNKITGTAYNTNYYTAELTLLGMFIASGNWWRP